MQEHECPECGQPMMLVNLFRCRTHGPLLGSFYCQSCDFADTAPLALGQAAIAVDGAETAAPRQRA
jgi:hypothetical protein